MYNNNEFEKVYLNILLEETNNEIIKRKQISEINVDIKSVDNINDDKIDVKELKKLMTSIKQFIEGRKGQTVFNALKMISSHLKGQEEKLKSIFNKKNSETQQRTGRKRGKNRTNSENKEIKITGTINDGD